MVTPWPPVPPADPARELPAVGSRLRTRWMKCSSAKISTPSPPASSPRAGPTWTSTAARRPRTLRRAFGLGSVGQHGEPGITAHSGARFMRNHFNDGGAGAPNDDWLILPQQNLTGTITLSYWDRVAGCRVSGKLRSARFHHRTLPANFTNLIVRRQRTFPTAWTQHTHDLSRLCRRAVLHRLPLRRRGQVHHQARRRAARRTGAGPRGGIEGIVTAAIGGAPIAGATVSASPARLATTTNAAGHYVHRQRLTSGTYSMTFSKVGYTTLTVPNNTVVVNDTITVNAALQPALTDHHRRLSRPSTTARCPPAGRRSAGITARPPIARRRPVRWLALQHRRRHVPAPHRQQVHRTAPTTSPASANDDWLILPAAEPAPARSRLSYWIALAGRATIPKATKCASRPPAPVPDDFTNLISRRQRHRQALGRSTPTTCRLTPARRSTSPSTTTPPTKFAHQARRRDARSHGRRHPPARSIIGTVRGATSDPASDVKVKVLTTDVRRPHRPRRPLRAAVRRRAAPTRCSFTHPLLDTLVVENVALAGEVTTTTNAPLKPSLTETLRSRIHLPRP